VPDGYAALGEPVQQEPSIVPVVSDIYTVRGRTGGPKLPLHDPAKVLIAGIFRARPSLSLLSACLR
jgi:hypothetical protein